MQIAISGAQCSGKTTLLNEMKNDSFFNNYNFYESFSTKLIKNKTNHSENTDLELQLRMLYEAVNQITEFGSTNSIFVKDNIFDRCVLDVLIYTCLSKNNINNALFQIACNSLLPRYDIIFVCGINGISLENDNKRSLNKEYRDDVDFMFRTFTYGMSNVVYLDSPKNRLEIVKTKIKNLKEYNK